MSFCQNCVNSLGRASKRRRLDVEEFDVGTLVWARLPDAVWWPAIVEKMSSSLFRIVYFDNECCLHGWVNPQDLLPFTGQEHSNENEEPYPRPREGQQAPPLHAQLQVAVNNARMTMARSREERVQVLHERSQLFDEGNSGMLVGEQGAGLAAGCSLGLQGLGQECLGQQETPDPVNDAVPTTSCAGQGDDEPAERSLANAPGGGDDADVLSGSDTVPAFGTSSSSSTSPSSQTSDPAYGADSSDSFRGEWAMLPPLETVSAFGWEPLSEEAVVPHSQEAVCPHPGSTRFDAVVPWASDDGGPGRPSSEAPVPSDYDDDDYYDDDDDELDSA